MAAGTHFFYTTYTNGVDLELLQFLSLVHSLSTQTRTTNIALFYRIPELE